MVSRGRNSPETLRRKATCWRSSVTKPTPAAAQRGCGPPACRGQARRSHMLCRSQCWRSRPTLQDAVHGHSRAPGGHPRPRRTHGRPPEHTRARTSAPPPRRVSAVPTTLGLCQPAEEQDITAGSHFCRPREEGRACRAAVSWLLARPPFHRSAHRPGPLWPRPAEPPLLPAQQGPGLSNPQPEGSF